MMEAWRPEISRAEDCRHGLRREHKLLKAKKREKGEEKSAAKEKQDAGAAYIYNIETKKKGGGGGGNVSSRVSICGVRPGPCQ